MGKSCESGAGTLTAMFVHGLGGPLWSEKLAVTLELEDLLGEKMRVWL